MLGVAWLASQSALTRVVQFAGQILLAWLLVPGDLGAVGLALTVVTLISAVFAFGTTDILIQRRRAIRLWASPAFALNASLSACGFALALACAPVAGAAYDVPALPWLIVVAALAMPVEALGAVPSAIMRADLRFREIAVLGMCEIVATQALAVAFASLGLGPYSILLPVPIVGAVRVLALWRLSRMRLRTGPGLRRWRLLAGRSATVLATRLVVAAVAQGDYVILGVLASDATVGLYYFAFKIAIMPVFSLAGSITGVLSPALVRIAHDPARQAGVTLSVTRLLNLVVMPACFLQAAVAGPVIHALFPAKWAGSVGLVQVLSVGLAFDACAWGTGALMAARGEFSRQLRLSAACAPAFFALAGGLGWGLRGSDPAMGVALGVAAYYGLLAPGCAALVLRGNGLGARRIAAALYGTAAVSAASVLLPSVALAWVGFGGLPGAFATGAAAVALQAAFVHALFPEELAGGMARIGSFLGPLRPAAWRRAAQSP